MSNPWRKEELQQARLALKERGIVRGDDVTCNHGSGIYLGLIWLDREGAMAVVDLGSDELHLCHQSCLAFDI